MWAICAVAGVHIIIIYRRHVALSPEAVATARQGSNQGQVPKRQGPEAWDRHRLGVARWRGVYHVGDASQVEECRRLRH